MSLASKLKKAKGMGIEFAEGAEPTEEEAVDKLIAQKQATIDQQKSEEKIRLAQQKKADEEAKKTQIILKDVDGYEVDQADYFWPRLVEQDVLNAKGEKVGTLKPTTETAPVYFNRANGLPVDREELIEVFVQIFPRAKGFLFYKLRDKEQYMIIVPLKYAKTISAANESQPGDFQRHAISFVQAGSVNLDSLRMQLQRVAGHAASISTEPIAR